MRRDAGSAISGASPSTSPVGAAPTETSTVTRRRRQEKLGRLRRHDGFVPVILMSAFPDREMKETASSLGAFALLEKPFDFEELRNALNACTA